MMTLIEDDAETNPSIPQSQLSYVRCLSDTHKQYTRFFDALLVPRPSHAAFFRDLRGFRSLPTTIKALALCDPAIETISKEQRKEHYRVITKKFLESRFAHPWCRKAASGSGNTKAGGWWGAEWSATGRRMSSENREKEEKLHKLLIPIWVIFRDKIFPGDTVVTEWWEETRLNPSMNVSSSPSVSSSDGEAANADETGEHSEREPKTAADISTLDRGHAVDDNGESDEEMAEQRIGTAAATGLLRIAAAGMLISSMPKMQQWKLKRELKKSSRR